MLFTRTLMAIKLSLFEFIKLFVLIDEKSIFKINFSNYLFGREINLYFKIFINIREQSLFKKMSIKLKSIIGLV